MRTICDVCESAPAILFCAADEAALCRSCDDKFVIQRKKSYVGSWLCLEWSGWGRVWKRRDLRRWGMAAEIKVHMCNKLASRHVRVGLADPSDVPRCDICENAPAFFYCEIDGSSLCLQCDMIVHVGGKRTHGRYLLLRQRVEFPGDKPNHFEDAALQLIEPVDNKEEKLPRSMIKDKLHEHRVASTPQSESNAYNHGNMEAKMIDLNARPQRTHGQPSNTQNPASPELA
ncbi:hypothetical protein Taro_054674 [Colocasia esculenta]|uniref:B box-type domain-containing protein n=1 Tax=Colocasia esculenta TaxID=4460 RepID=A0A843XRD3_COLES|nr:hypothetical protein [Colocasia esculenta]